MLGSSRLVTGPGACWWARGTGNCHSDEESGVTGPTFAALESGTSSGSNSGHVLTFPQNQFLSDFSGPADFRDLGADRAGPGRPGQAGSFRAAEAGPASSRQAGHSWFCFQNPRKISEISENPLKISGRARKPIDFLEFP